MSLIPDTLTIFISTKIPKYLHFIYNSKYTNKETDSPVYFNPLVLYNQKIESPNIFFDEKAFDEYLMDNKQKKLPTLIKATEAGNVEKNMKKVLKALFERGKVLYLEN